MQLEEADLRRIVALLEEQAEPAPDGEMRINYDGFAQVCVGGGALTQRSRKRHTRSRPPIDGCQLDCRLAGVLKGAGCSPPHRTPARSQGHRGSPSLPRPLQVATECLSSLGLTVGPFFQASTFLQFERDGAGAISLPLYVQYLSQHANAMQLVSVVAVQSSAAAASRLAWKQGAGRLSSCFPCSTPTRCSWRARPLFGCIMHWMRRQLCVCGSVMRGRMSH